MNRLTSQQRKLVYLGCMVLLLIPIILLGRPGAPPSKMQPAGDAGGKLASLRTEHDLAESALGNVDPTSATMNLVLLGLRGVAASTLALQLDQYKNTKNWAELEATTESIILLQPHYTKVWEFNGWNMAYNVSAEWDDVRDRYRWVKRGIKFYQRGTRRNQKSPDLYWYTGDTLGKKIGRSDEWRQFRRFFRQDPDKQWEVNGVPGPDLEINPGGMKEDNYLMAKEWFQEANDVWDEFGNRPKIMANILFRSYPARAQLDYPAARQREGKFDEITRLGWEQGFEDWTQKYGMEPYPSPAGDFHLEWTVEEINKAEPDPEKRRVLIQYLSSNHSTTNYLYWRSRALAEREQNTLAAHRELYDAQQALVAGDAVQAEQLAFSGMEKYEKLLADYPELNDTETKNEGLMGQLVWRSALELRGSEIPEKYPLKKLWSDNQDMLPEVRRELDMQLSPDY